MGGFSVWHWSVIAGWLLGGAVPLFLFQRRLGQRGWLSLLAIIPLGLFLVLWILAFVRWEREA
jgi:hypothetical protein